MMTTNVVYSGMIMIIIQHGLIFGLFNQGGVFVELRERVKLALWSCKYHLSLCCSANRKRSSQRCATSQLSVHVMS